MKKLVPFLIISLFLFNSCKKEKSLQSIEIDRDEITMHYDENKQLGITFNPLDVEVKPRVTWFSENTDVAEVDSSGLVEGVRVGETRIMAQTDNGKFQDYCDIIIEPISNLYQQPIIEWGKSFDYVKENETRDYITEIEDAILFEGENSDVKNVMYMFENRELNSVMVMLRESESVLEEAALYLKERHEYKGAIDTGLAFKVSNDVVAVLGADYDLGLFVMYMEYSSTKSSVISDMKNNFEKIKTQILSQL